MGDAASIGTTFLNIAWPALVRSAIRSGPIRLHTSQSVASTTTGADISDAIAADLRRALPSMLARLVVRSAAKAKITDAVGDEYGRFAGVLAGIAGGVLERADTRSWQLLPAHIAVVRTRVAAGGVDARITMGGEFDTFSTELPMRTVAPGELIVTSTRIFPGQSSPARF